MAIAQLDNMASLSCDIFYDILRRLDGPTLASAACACATFHSISKEERLWENVCSSMWPLTNREDVRTLILSLGGYRKFYADCFPLIVSKEVIEHQRNGYLDYPDEWNEAEYFYDIDESQNIEPSDFVSIVDIRFKEKVICSKVLWGIPNANGVNGWFNSCPFQVDLLTHAARNDENVGEVTLSAADGLPPIACMEKERKDGKLWQELCESMKLSWIIVNKEMKQAANLASWSPLGGQRHWPTDRDFALRFGSVLPAKYILPCQLAECILIMKFRVLQTEAEGDQTLLSLTEMSMQFEDMDGARVNGRNSLLILKEALSCCRSKNYDEALKSCHLYSEVQRELREEKMRNESRLDRLYICSGIIAFASFWYYILSDGGSISC